ncbi:MAG TPA: hypothetical protein VNK82_05920 [Terriglobales bacterium]|nr:hypothetical protein [Terriglobales bacterium]
MKQQVLANEFSRRAARILAEWANLAGSRPNLVSVAACNRFMKRHSMLFAGSSPRRGRLWPLTAAQIGQARNLLRQAWDEPDIRRREWLIFRLRATYEYWRRLAQEQAGEQEGIRLRDVEAERQRRKDLHEAFGFDSIPLPATAPELAQAERVFFHFTRLAPTAMHCANPECPAPYFFRRKKGQRYCSAKCSGPAKSAAKRRWWHEVGKKLRARRAKEVVARTSRPKRRH